MLWIEILLKVSHTATEAVADIFQEAGSGGVVIEDPRVLNAYINSGQWDYTDLKPLVDEGVCVLKAYLPGDDGFPALLGDIRGQLTLLEGCQPGSIKGEMLFREVDEEDWSNAWKQYFHPQRVGERLVVKPSWEDYEAQPGDIVIELDPGMAFGTGTHHTTCLCMEALENAVQPGHTVFDVGTGSGILAIAAAKLGAKSVVAIDLDGVAVKVAKENVEKSGLASVIAVREGDLLTAVAGKADVIAANIIASIICLLLPDVPEKLNPGGLFIASGIIEDRLEEVLAAARENGFTVESVKKREGWALVSMRKEK